MAISSNCLGMGRRKEANQAQACTSACGTLSCFAIGETHTALVVAIGTLAIAWTYWREGISLADALLRGLLIVTMLQLATGLLARVLERAG